MIDSGISEEYLCVVTQLSKLCESESGTSFFFPSDQGILRRFRIADCRNCRRQEKFDVPHEGTTCFSLGRKEIGHTEREVCHCGSKLAGGLQRSKQRRKGPPQEEVSGADGKNYWQEETLWLLEGFGTRKPLGARGSPVLFIDSTRKNTEKKREQKLIAVHSDNRRKQ